MVAAIFWLSLTPSPPQIDVAAGDKLGHFAAYGALMFWFCRFYPNRRTRLFHGIAFIAMGVGLEVLQGMTGYRTYDVLDMVANSVGVLLGAGAAALMRPRGAPAAGRERR
jgi:VanZ family protein